MKHFERTRQERASLLETMGYFRFDTRRQAAKRSSLGLFREALQMENILHRDLWRMQISKKAPRVRLEPYSVARDEG